jgi:hypothetical protein
MALMRVIFIDLYRIISLRSLLSCDVTANNNTADNTWKYTDDLCLKRYSVYELCDKPWKGSGVK